MNLYTARTGLSGHKAIIKHLPSGPASPLLWSVLARALSIVFRGLGLELKKENKQDWLINGILIWHIFP